MATLADGGRITEAVVEEEIARLRHDWQATSAQSDPRSVTAQLLPPEIHHRLDLFEHIQLAGIAEVCRHAGSMAEAGRRLFDKSREQKKSVNDSHRLRQLLNKYELDFSRFKP
jgi:transcriptional regulatory protein RtcR